MSHRQRKAGTAHDRVARTAWLPLMPGVLVSAFYRFMRLPAFASLRGPIQALCDSHGLKGILLLAPEGINATLAGRPNDLDEVVAELRRLLPCDDLAEKRSFADAMPFLRMKVRLKAEIVTMGEATADPLDRTGVAVDPKAWNALITDPDVLVVDVRNAFECAVGSFEGAINPQTRSFRHFPAFVRGKLDPARHKAIAMFCTGGIRCEKASSFMLREGFETVYQLKGGILSYLQGIAPDESLWRGSCFVFDQRVALDHGLMPADVGLCFGCRHPLTLDDRASPQFVAGVSCSHCAGFQTPEKAASARERHRQVTIAESRGRPHLGQHAQGEPARPAREPAVAAVSTRAREAPSDVRGDARSGSR